jgi:AcrR family transcriptional regulator
MKLGTKPDLEQIAEEAMVSRATAYRYFPGVEALLVEAALDTAAPVADEVLRDASPDDPVARVQRVDTAMHEMILANEAQLRIMLMHSLQRGAGSELPPRQNRRTPLIEAALAPARERFKPADLRMLTRAHALVIGTESVIVFKDVLQLDDAETRKVKRWTIRALVQAAIRSEAAA